MWFGGGHISCIGREPYGFGECRGVGADDAYDLIVVSPLRVSHAGGRGSSVNGRYVPTDSYNGKPKYRQQNGQAIIYFDVFWKINFRDDCRGWYYSHPHHDAVVPPRGEWTTEGYSGGDADPAPEVGVASAPYQHFF